MEIRVCFVPQPDKPAEHTSAPAPVTALLLGKMPLVRSHSQSRSRSRSRKQPTPRAEGTPAGRSERSRSAPRSQDAARSAGGSVWGSLRRSVKGTGSRSRGRRAGSVSGARRVGVDSRESTSDYEQGALYISVSDSGAGISAEDQAKLFKGVVQFNPDKLQGGGGR